MILRCAGCISSRSASVIAFRAPSPSPLLIASSAGRTAPRIWVRRDLLTMVRRAILRVAFFAEEVLAIAQKFLRQRSGRRAGHMTPAVALALETLVVFSGVPEHAGSEDWLTRSRSKNSG